MKLRMNYYSVLLFLSGVLFFFSGCLFYRLERGASFSGLYWLESLPLWNLASLNQMALHTPGFWQMSFPSFIHVLSFCLITAGVMGNRERSFWAIPLFWILLNMSLELCQKYTELTGISGTFDVNDIWASTLGGIAASFLIFMAYRRWGFKRGEGNILSSGKEALLYAIVLTGVVSNIASTPCGTNRNSQTTGQACVNDGNSGGSNYHLSKPVYMSYKVLRNSIQVSKPRAIETFGKIYRKENRLYINEPNKGVHVFNNTDPKEPKKEFFISIPGNIDIAIKGQVLFADSYVDFVGIDISNLPDFKIVSRLEKVFPYNPYQNISDPNITLDEADENKGVVVGYQKNNQPL